MQKKLYRLIAATLVAGSTLSAASLAQAAEDTDAIAAEAAADTVKPAAKSTAKTAAQPAAVDLTPQAGKKTEKKSSQQPAYIERSDIFETATLRREATSPTYRLYRGDTVAVKAVGFTSGGEGGDTNLAGPGISGFTVGIDGYVQLPYVGNVKMEGLTLDEAKEVLMESLTQYLRIPDLSLLVTSYGPRKVYVMGEVTKPGIVNLSIDNMNAYAALASAGGWTSHGRSTRTQIIRVIDGTMYYRRLDMKKYIMKHDLTQNVMVEDGDILYVPPTNGIKLNEDILPYVSIYAIYHNLTN